MSKVYITGAKRTAIGAFGGTIKDIPAHTLCASVLKSVISQTGISSDKIDETIIGNIISAGQGMGPGRQAAIYAGIPVEKPAYSVNMLCGSGMKSVMIGATDIKMGNASIVAAAGMENMSLAPFLLPADVRFGAKMGNLTLLDSMLSDGLIDIFNNYHMGITAENISEKYSITREKQDAFALESQMRTKKAIASGRFKEEITPIEVSSRKKTVIFDTDEYPRPETSMDSLAKLRPAFKKDGTVTAGNASGINDGASALLLVSEEALKTNSLEPLAEITGFSQAGVDPAYMGLGPVPAIKKLLSSLNMNIKDIDLLELNEAFAAQSLAVIKELSEHYSVTEKRITERTNVNGGAIALGHPVGASGNRIIVTLIYEMKKRGAEYGLASLCIGGGMGTAILIKM